MLRHWRLQRSLSGSLAEERGWRYQINVVDETVRYRVLGGPQLCRAIIGIVGEFSIQQFVRCANVCGKVDPVPVAVYGVYASFLKPGENCGFRTRSWLEQSIDLFLLHVVSIRRMARRRHGVDHRVQLLQILLLKANAQGDDAVICWGSNVGPAMGEGSQFLVNGGERRGTKQHTADCCGIDIHFGKHTVGGI